MHSSITSRAYVDEIVSDSYLSSLKLIIAGVNTAADSAEAEARARLDGTSRAGTSYVSNLSINGVVVTVDGTMNQTVFIPGGQLVINEQQVLSDGTLVVNALHAIVSSVADAVVASGEGGHRRRERERGADHDLLISWSPRSSGACRLIGNTDDACAEGRASTSFRAT